MGTDVIGNLLGGCVIESVTTVVAVAMAIAVMSTVVGKGRVMSSVVVRGNGVHCVTVRVSSVVELRRDVSRGNVSVTEAVAIGTVHDDGGRVL